MGKLSKLFFGSAVLGAIGATVYTYVKNYNELTPKTEDQAQRGTVEGTETEQAAERAYTNIDMDAAKEAATKTFETVKAAATKAWGVAKDSAKDVYDNVMENYGDEINVAKEKVTEKYGEAKDAAGEKWEEVKNTVSEKYAEYKNENPEVFEKIDGFKDQAKKFYDDAVEKVGDVVDKIIPSDETVDGEAEEV
ncbi:MAG: hypothetical protein IJL43_02165, partial [Lachnospiraceae bacterium]|nr:hypothetical protein [Lachnospiraceae bacterium]